MKVLAVFALVCAMMALTSAEAVAEAEAEPEAEPEKAQAELDVAKRTCFRRCPCGWTRIGHRCFRYICHSLTWPQAERNCVSLGGHLASVHSVWEYRRIRLLVFKKTRHHPQAWLGANDRCQEGVWRWSDGSRLNYKGWCCGEPNNAGNQDCLQMNFGGHKCWDDRQCHHRLPSVCVRN
uniref:type-2 ice-structuring protein-like isoform X2 n=1 Tax=Semicossyphus pulcher TaxID=241346 RepID=UPI0037E83AEF